MGNCLVVSPSLSLSTLDKHENKNKENEAHLFKQINLPIQIPVVGLSNGARSPSPAKQKEAGLENAMAVVVPKNLEDLRETSSFTYGEMRAATRNFRPDQILGEGGFGVVYKGVIDDIVRSGFKTTLVAVKVLNREGLQGEKEWLVIS